MLKTGSALTSFKYEPEDSPGTVYNINIVPFQKQPAGLPASARALTWIDVVTIIGVVFGYLMGGAVVVENVFSWNGSADSRSRRSTIATTC